MKKRAIFLLSITLMMGLISGPMAQAHSKLLSSTPAQGVKLKSAPTTVALTFNETLLILKKNTANRVNVLSPSGESIINGVPHVSGKKITAPLSGENLTSGKYKVTYRVTSADGHVISGSYTYTLTL